MDAKWNNYRQYILRFGQTDFGPVLDWLHAQRDRVPCVRPSPLHGDYHPYNVLVRADGAPAVIDWTGFDFQQSWFVI